MVAWRQLGGSGRQCDGYFIQVVLDEVFLGTTFGLKWRSKWVSESLAQNGVVAVVAELQRWRNCSGSGSDGLLWQYF